MSIQIFDLTHAKLSSEAGGQAPLVTLGFAQTIERLTRDILEQNVYAFKGLFVLTLPVELFLEGLFGKYDFIHRQAPLIPQRFW